MYGSDNYWCSLAHIIQADQQTMTDYSLREESYPHNIIVNQLLVSIIYPCIDEYNIILIPLNTKL